jgi:hypothetical protein
MEESDSEVVSDIENPQVDNTERKDLKAKQEEAEVAAKAPSEASAANHFIGKYERYHQRAYINSQNAFASVGAPDVTRRSSWLLQRNLRPCPKFWPGRAPLPPAILVCPALFFLDVPADCGSSSLFPHIAKN